MSASIMLVGPPSGGPLMSLETRGSSIIGRSRYSNASSSGLMAKRDLATLTAKLDAKRLHSCCRSTSSTTHAIVSANENSPVRMSVRAGCETGYLCAKAMMVDDSSEGTSHGSAAARGRWGRSMGRSGRASKLGSSREVAESRSTWTGWTTAVAGLDGESKVGQNSAEAILASG